MATKRYEEYGNDSISVLKDEERVRKLPAVIFGSDDLEGCKHAVFEILSNAVDEAREGHGDRVIVTRYEDLSIEVEDFGRGCPVDYNEKEKRYNWELVFCEMYAGGKYNKGVESYSYSLGMNGLGACATQYASEFFDVTVRRDGFRYDLHFERGRIKGGMKKEPTDRGRKTGSLFHWKPDNQVFTDINIPVEYFRDMLRRQAIANKGVHFIFRNQVGKRFEEEEFYYENGIQQYIEETVGDDAFTMPVFWETERRGRDADSRDEMRLRITASFCFSKKVSMVEYYHNSSWLEHGGSPDRAVRFGLVAAFDRYLRENNKYGKNESKIIYQDIQDSLVMVTNCFSTIAAFENQTKKAVNSKFVQEAMTAFLKERFEVWFIENKQEAELVANQILINKRARESAERAKTSTRKQLSTKLDISNRVQKFVDCRSRDSQQRELYIVEGDSALGSVKLSRDAEFQGIMPVRGKILNCLKADYNKIFASPIITDLIKVLGCGVEVQGKKSKELSSFDVSQLRWNKIVICTDADVDGFQIRTLILTMLYRLCPTLIRDGYVYIAESPLFEITYKGKTWFAYNEAEKAKILREDLDGKKPDSIQRSKGLGENDPEMMWMTTMNPETRRLIKVMPEDAERTSHYFDVLLGDALNERKVFIAENGARYLDLADIS
ncbi:MAG: DNA topoisomerase [Oscillospiraceae bacterium]|nr:DNA topoisomerase [Oscillospiraceae bacterium]MBQ9929828.1 DNA topoisomerase [Oscillospiraceae bacterium]